MNNLRTDLPLKWVDLWLKYHEAQLPAFWSLLVGLQRRERRPPELQNALEQIFIGHPLLTTTAVEAVKQWRYLPTLLNGQAVEVITQIDVNFTLSH